MTEDEALRTLRERRDWLTVRAEGKEKIGWENQYDMRERDALSWALAALAAVAPAPPTQHVVGVKFYDRAAKGAAHGWAWECSCGDGSYSYAMQQEAERDAAMHRPVAAAPPTEPTGLCDRPWGRFVCGNPLPCKHHPVAPLPAAGPEETTP